MCEIRAFRLDRPSLFGDRRHRRLLRGLAPIHMQTNVNFTKATSPSALLIAVWLGGTARHDVSTLHWQRQSHR
jgi:hypothetical protein